MRKPFYLVLVKLVLVLRKTVLVLVLVLNNFQGIGIGIGIGIEGQSIGIVVLVLVMVLKTLRGNEGISEGQKHYLKTLGIRQIQRTTLPKQFGKLSFTFGKLGFGEMSFGKLSLTIFLLNIGGTNLSSQYFARICSHLVW